MKIIYQRNRLLTQDIQRRIFRWECNLRCHEVMNSFVSFLGNIFFNLINAETLLGSEQDTLTPNSLFEAPWPHRERVKTFTNDNVMWNKSDIYALSTFIKSQV